MLQVGKLGKPRKRKLDMNRKSITLIIILIWTKISKVLAIIRGRIYFYLVPRALKDLVKYCVPSIFGKSVRAQAVKEGKGILRFLRARIYGEIPLISKVLQLIGPVRILRHLEKYLRFRVRSQEDYPVVYWMPERNTEEIASKIEAFSQIASATRLDRVRVFRELGRLELLLGNDLTACVYAIRAMRLAGNDLFQDLQWVCRTLQRAGFPLEAEAATAMYGNPQDRHIRCKQLLDAATERGMNPPRPCEFEIYDDRRGIGDVKVTVITSLYNAAGKLTCFLQALQSQTLNRTGELELILVDSGSPTDEYDVICNLELNIPIRWLYVRTPTRETIQTAWNRAIGLARAPYLTFLGVDETVIPSALAELAAELNADETLDWVQADSLITEVDGNGLLMQDVMKYDRTGYTPSHVYLETCYLSWVGALYRRSIHERFGYYDGTFSAAGDTEFKGRVLPYIKTKHLPKMLGVFLNYQEERTTASPKAEIEDLRAWYLHRTPAGIERAFRAKNTSDLESMLSLSLHYRKSYCEHFSSDVEFAANTIEILKKYAPQSALLSLDAGIARLLHLYRALDYLPDFDQVRINNIVKQAHAMIAEIQAQHRQNVCLPSVKYDVLNDNRHEQHHFVWAKTTPSKPTDHLASATPGTRRKTQRRAA